MSLINSEKDLDIEKEHRGDSGDFEDGWGHREPYINDLEVPPGGNQEEVLTGDIISQKRIQQPRAEPARSALSRIVTGQSAVSSDPGPPPDGGFRAWLMSFMGHLVIFNTWGFISSFGVFQTYYVNTLRHPPSDISWIGSVQIFLLFFIGTASGRATDAGLFRPIFVAGCFFQLLGLFMTSLATKYWQLFLAQGVCIGVGNGLQFCPTMSLISTYFSKKRALAMGVAATGSATGGLVYPVIVQQLLPKVGFGWTMRVLGFVTIASSAIAIAFLRTRLPPRKSGPIVEWAAFKEAPYVLYCVGMFLCFWGLYFAFYYVGV
jgi:MFS family permease